MRAPFLCAALSYVATAASALGGEPPARKPDPLDVVIRRVEKDFQDGSLRRLAESADAVSARRRVAAAFVLGRSGSPASRPILEKMLADPDLVVRRVAAESLHGKAALRPETAKRHGYADVLATEARARELAGVIRDRGLSKRCRAAREMLALGWPATWQVHLLCHDRDDTVAVTVERISWERVYPEGVQPAWADEVERGLEQRVDFDFEDTPIDEALRDLSARSGIKIGLKKDWLPEGWRGEDHRVSLKVTDTPLQDSLSWLLNRADMCDVFRDGGIAVGQRDLVWEHAMTHVDSRDRGLAVEKGWNPVRNYGFSSNIEGVEGNDEDGNASFLGFAKSVRADTRVVAAFVAGYSKHPRAGAILKGLLADADALVRRVAAESFFGDDAFDREKAEQYGYVEVLAAEEKIRELAGAIRNADKRAQYRMTREMIALGRAAMWQTHLFSHDLNETVALSAAYAFQEVEYGCENVPPPWAREVERKLEQKVQFDFKDTPIKEAVAELFRTSGIDFRFSPSCENMDWGEQPPLVTLNSDTAWEWSLSLALSWITSLAILDYGIADGGVLIVPHCNIHLCRTVLLDVRDLEASGLHLDWLKQINAQVPTKYEWDEIIDPESFLGNHGGLLEIWACGGGEWKQGLERFNPVRTYLNKLRGKRGLPPEPD